MTTAQLIPLLLTALVSVGASSGFWQWMMRRNDKSTETSRLLLVLAYDKIVELGMSYIERGSISRDEYEDLKKSLHDPYKRLGGNGVADRVMEEVSRLPFRSHGRYSEIVPGRSERENFNG